MDTGLTKKNALIITLALMPFGIGLSYWLWQNLINICQLRFTSLFEIIKSMTIIDYLLLIIGLTIIQEAGMIFWRYYLGIRGKEQRFYVLWKDKKFQVHHLHWGCTIIFMGFFGQLTKINTNMLLIAIGFSFIFCDLIHHAWLKIFHGDLEGDGPFQNPFK